MKISNPGQQSSYKKKNYFSIKKGTQVFRILPAMGEAAERGKWYQYHEVHFGFRNATGRMFVFQSPEVRNQKNRQMIEVSDAAKERNSKIMAKIAEIKEALKANPNHPESEKLQGQLSKLDEIRQRFNSEKRYYYNAMDANGNIGLLKLKTKEKAALEAVRKTMEAEEGVDPVKIEGAFLTFTKSGDGQLESTVQVSGNYLQQQDAAGRKVRVLNTHTVDESMFAKLEAEAFDLLDLFSKPTAEEVKAMVDGGPEAVGAVMERYNRSFKAKESTQTSAPPVVDQTDDETGDDDDVDSLLSTSSTSAPPAAAPKVEAKTEVKAETKQEPAKTETKTIVTEQSDDDFLKGMGLE